MNKKILTLSDLYNFCLKQNFSYFNANESGCPIAVRVDGTFSADDHAQDGLLPVVLQACHTLDNLNQSTISEESMREALPSFKLRPILGSIIETEDGIDFNGHDTTEDENGNEIYIEKPIGVIREIGDAALVYDEKKDKTYVVVNGVIFEEYSQAAEIIRERKTLDVSVELHILEMAFNAKTKKLEIKKFYFNGVTILGKHVRPGMHGANLKIEDFAVTEDSTKTFSSENDEWKERIEMLESSVHKLVQTYESSSIEKNQEGGNRKMEFEKLIEKYNIKPEDVTFDYAELSDEELKAKFEEVFGAENNAKTCPECGATIEDDSAKECPECGEDLIDDDPVDEPDDFKKPKEDDESKKKRCSIEVSFGDEKFAAEVSINEQLQALSILVNSQYAESDGVYYSVIAYDSHLIMIDYWSNKAYKQAYVKNEDSVSLSGDREEVFANYLTKAEEESLVQLRANYDELVTYKQNKETEIIRCQKKEILNNEKYLPINHSESFKDLVSNMDKYSVEDVETKAKAIFADHIFANSNFAAEIPRANSVKVFSDKQETKHPYKTLFKD